jgi:hypothetical protein
MRGIEVNSIKSKSYVMNINQGAIESLEITVDTKLIWRNLNSLYVRLTEKANWQTVFITSQNKSVLGNFRALTHCLTLAVFLTLSAVVETTEGANAQPNDPPSSYFTIQAASLENGQVPQRYRAIYEKARNKRLTENVSKGFATDAADPTPSFTVPAKDADGKANKISFWMQHSGNDTCPIVYPELAQSVIDCGPGTPYPDKPLHVTSYTFSDGDTASSLPPEQQAKKGIDYDPVFKPSFTNQARQLTAVPNQVTWTGNSPPPGGGQNCYNTPYNTNPNFNCPDDGRNRTVYYDIQLLPTTATQAQSRKRFTVKYSEPIYWVTKNVTSDTFYIDITYYTPVQIVLRQFIPSPAVKLQVIPNPDIVGGLIYTYTNLCFRLPGTKLYSAGCHVMGDGRGSYPRTGSDPFSYTDGYSRYFIYAVVTADPTVASPLISSKLQWCFSGNYYPSDTVADTTGKPYWWRNVPSTSSIFVWDQVPTNPSTLDLRAVRDVTGTDTVVVDMKALASDPIIALAPELKGSLHVSVSQSAGTLPIIEVKTDSYHSGFPGLELWANGDKLYTYNPLNIATPFALANSPQYRLGSFNAPVDINFAQHVVQGKYEGTNTNVPQCEPNPTNIPKP